MKRSHKSYLTPAHLVLAAVLAASATSIQAQFIATGQITDAPAGSGAYDYTITLHNSASSTVSIESLWYAGEPGPQFYLPGAPTEIFPPIGWLGSALGPSIQLYALSSPYAIAPGGSLSFSYLSMDTPAQEFGNSSAYPGHPPVGTSVAFQFTFAGANDIFVVQPAPEPSSMAILLAGSLGLLAVLRRGKTLHAAPV